MVTPSAAVGGARGLTASGLAGNRCSEVPYREGVGREGRQWRAERGIEVGCIVREDARLLTGSVSPVTFRLQSHPIDYLIKMMNSDLIH